LDKTSEAKEEFCGTSSPVDLNDKVG